MDPTILPQKRDLAHYLDDLMAAFAKGQKERLHEFKAKYTFLSRLLGLLENSEKDEEGTLIKFLGRLVNSTTFIVSIPPDKVQKLRDLVAEALERQNLTILQAQQLAGICSFCSTAVQLGCIFCRRLWTFIAEFKPYWQKTVKRRIPPLLAEDLRWWQELFPSHNGKRFFDDQSRATVHLFADASIVGLGAFSIDGFNGQKAVIGRSWQGSCPSRKP